MKLLVLGTRSFAPEIADVASDIPGVEIAGFVENMDRDKCSEKLEGLPIHWVDDIASMRDESAGASRDAPSGTPPAMRT